MNRGSRRRQLGLGASERQFQGSSPLEGLVLLRRARPHIPGLPLGLGLLKLDIFTFEPSGHGEQPATSHLITLHGRRPRNSMLEKWASRTISSPSGMFGGHKVRIHEE